MDNKATRKTIVKATAKQAITAQYQQTSMLKQHTTIDPATQQDMVSFKIFKQSNQKLFKNQFTTNRSCRSQDITDSG